MAENLGKVKSLRPHRGGESTPSWPKSSRHTVGDTIQQKSQFRCGRLSPKILLRQDEGDF